MANLTDIRHTLAKAYRAQELLRLEHNALGQNFLDGALSEAHFREYQRYSHRTRNMRLCNVISRLMDVVRYADMIATGFSLEDFDLEFTKASKYDDSLDAEFDLETLEGIEGA